jgi:hypothetical protein
MGVHKIQLYFPFLSFLFYFILIFKFVPNWYYKFKFICKSDAAQTFFY